MSAAARQRAVFDGRIPLSSPGMFGKTGSGTDLCFFTSVPVQPLFIDVSDFRSRESQFESIHKRAGSRSRVAYMWLVRLDLPPALEHINQSIMEIPG